MTPESFNTPMGVVKTIRGSLKPYHEIFICEMGAYVPGEIKEICDIANPDMSVITCIGEQHLDTFKTQENIIKTKAEIFENTVEGGTIFVNLYDEHIKALKIDNNVEKIAFGESGSYCYVTSSKITTKGTSLTIVSKEHGTFEVTTKLLGQHNIENIMLCVTIALRLGVTPEQINRSLYDIQPVKHRLSYHKTDGGYTIIDDAFNSNPIGSRNAVEVLHIFEGNKKIIMTPGMIGLGDRQDTLNEKFGEYIGKGADYAVLVGDKQTTAIQKGIRSTGFPEDRIIIKNSTKEAFEYVYSIIEKDDVLLIENDLPDIFNE
jgi:UDP-N-acetylmuramoyl-tripeptide--D-alanyl-D-alanine ligase